MARKESVIIVKEIHPLEEEQRAQVIAEKLAEMIKYDLKMAKYKPA